MSETEYQLPGGDFINETEDEKQHIVPGGDWLDSDASGGPGPGPSGDRRRPVIVAMG